jgi:hypothetical protein
MADLTLNGQPVLELDLHLPLNGAWSAEIQVATDTELAVGDSVTLGLPDLELAGRVVRAGIFAERLRVRLTGGSVDWSAVQAVKHYKKTTAAQVLSDVQIETDTTIGDDLPFWTRAPGTTGSTVQAIAAFLGHNWRVNPDGTVRLRAEAPAAVDITDLVEVSRDPARGLVEVAPEAAVILPGVLVGADSAGDVLYSQGSDGLFRCRYYTEARGRVRHALERVIRWVMRDTLFLGQYTAEVIRQASDGTLDLLPDDARLRSQGLQSVPIRHGLPGVTVEVPVGERVLLGFDAGDPSQPYASLWHEGQVTRVNIGGEDFVALADLVSARLDLIQATFDAHIHITTATVGATPTPGVIAPTATPIGPLDAVASEVLATR